MANREEPPADVSTVEAGEAAAQTLRRDLAVPFYVRLGAAPLMNPLSSCADATSWGVGPPPGWTESCG